MSASYNTAWFRCKDGRTFDVIVPPSWGITMGLVVQCPWHADETMGRRGTNGRLPVNVAEQDRLRAKAAEAFGTGAKERLIYRVTPGQTRPPFSLRLFRTLPALEAPLVNPCAEHVNERCGVDCTKHGPSERELHQAAIGRLAVR